ncbi:hypothetical protein WN944_001906 [Citrus x changshan-huyou]|uniref:Uncharacterized protein n=1 Tax=Citrus x changshan-huyou TaxID=2935761 RepID=A0AAP0MI15_9ROSI
MVVVESASQDSVVSSAGSISASNGQDHPKQNGGTMVMSLDQGLYNQNNQRSNGGGDFKRDMRELQELFSKLNPMAEDDRPHPIVGLHHSIATSGQAYQASDLYSS